MIQCTNPQCCTENPAIAKFCRKCGTAFTPTDRYKQLLISILSKIFKSKKDDNREAFTLDTFRNISFQPVSVVTIRFVNRFIIFLCVLFTALFFFATSSVGEEILYSIATGVDAESWYHVAYITLLNITIVALSAFSLMKCIYKKIRFNLNADYIEKRFLHDEIVRIAKKSRMGLFDMKNNKVLLPSDYSDIIPFDNKHLLISKGAKTGLYSLTYQRIIIPVLYDSISQFSNSVVTVTSKNIEYHYDVKGSKLR